MDIRYVGRPESESSGPTKPNFRYCAPEMFITVGTSSMLSSWIVTMIWPSCSSSATTPHRRPQRCPGNYEKLASSGCPSVSDENDSRQAVFSLFRRVFACYDPLPGQTNRWIEAEVRSAGCSVSPTAAQLGPRDCRLRGVAWPNGCPKLDQARNRHSGHLRLFTYFARITLTLR